MITIVGVVGNVLHNGLDTQARPELYLPHAQTPQRTLGWIRQSSLVVRATGESTALLPALRATPRDLDPNVPLTQVRTLDDVAQAATLNQRFIMTLLVAFAGLALIIASVGVYGVVSFAVAQRTREFGVRIAMGAEPEQLLRGVLGGGLKLSLIGVVLHKGT